MARALIPNSTQVPDVILDHWMAELSGSEFKVLLYVARRTYGFGKDSDRISLSQLASGIRRRDGTALDRGTGLSRTAVKDACAALIDRGLLVRVANMSPDGREAAESTYRLNLYAPLPAGCEGVGRFSAYLGRKTAVGGPNTDPGVGRNLSPQETDQETDQETASAAVTASDDDELVGELVGHGVGRSVAARLAAEKPDVCRRCLTYLPFAKVRTTPGAWLANAIRDEYGPPDGYAASPARERSAPPPASASRSRRLPAARLETMLALMPQDYPEAAAAFSTYVATERERAETFADRLNLNGKRVYFTAFDDPAQQLVLFERWLLGVGKSFARLMTESAHPASPQPDSSGGRDAESPADLPARSGTQG